MYSVEGQENGGGGTLLNNDLYVYNELLEIDEARTVHLEVR